VSLSERALVRRVDQQLRLMGRRGGDQAGYVGRYGSIFDLIHYGEGGEAAYEADRAELAAREQELAAYRRGDEA